MDQRSFLTIALDGSLTSRDVSSYKDLDTQYEAKMAKEGKERLPMSVNSLVKRIHPGQRPQV